MTKEDVFYCMQELQKLYCHGAKTLSRQLYAYKSAVQAFIAVAVAFSECGLDINELYIWLDLNSITAVDDVDFIKLITVDALDLIDQQYSCILTSDYLKKHYIATLDRLRKALVEHSAISS